MDRRTYARALGVGIATAGAGCLGGTVVHEEQRQLRLDPGGYWASRLPAVGGSGAISFAVRAERRFDVYVFTDEAALATYENYHETGDAGDAPTGRPDLGGTAVYDDARERYAVTTSNDGARQAFDTDEESTFVVDNSDYGMGAEPGANSDALGVFVDLEVVDNQF